MLQRGLGRLVLALGHAAVHVGNTLGGQRVGAQIRPAAVVIQAAGVLQLFKHAHGALRGKTCGLQQGVANAVGLALHVTRKAQLVLNRGRLPAHNQGIGRIRALAGRQRAQHHAGNHDGHVLLLLPEHARNVALRHVRELVGHHRGQLIAAAHRTNQPQVHPQIATGQGKGVNALVAAQQNLPGKALADFLRQIAALTRRFHQRLPDAEHIGMQLRVVDIVRVAVERGNDAVAQPALFAGRQVCAIAHAGQGQLGLCTSHIAHTGQTQHRSQQGTAQRRKGEGKWLHGNSGQRHKALCDKNSLL